MVIGDALKLTSDILKGSGVEDYVFEAQHLTMHALSISSLQLAVSKHDEISQSAYERLLELAKKRAGGYPLQYIIGEWEFFGLPFKVGEGVLIPRQDTERLVELAVSFLKNRENAVAVDLCSGSGCIAVSAANAANAQVYAVELSERAAVFLEKNITLNNCKKNVTMIKGNIFDEAIRERVPLADAILSNPPYLSQSDMNVLQTEVRSEPQMALFGGESGYDFYKKIFAFWIDKLKDGGLFAVEIGMGQEQRVSEYMASAGIKPHSLTDYSGIVRVIYGYKDSK